MSEEFQVPDGPEVTIDAFQGAVDKTFTVSVDESMTYEMTLIRAEELPAENSKRKSAPFVLTFHAGSDCILRDGLYTVANDDVGSNEIYLTLESDDDVGKTYEALYH